MLTLLGRVLLHWHDLQLCQQESGTNPDGSARPAVTKELSVG